ncbi:MAG: RNA polymerase sigma factor [Candidatus Doudnabacteria bacterium]|nr:RNA polymerase sigma factor [Candidatus Doudnabacteria bacterium]
MSETSHYSPNKKEKDIGALTTAAAAGDQRAFELLYKEFFPKVSRFVTWRVNDRETAEDLVAEVFLKGWESLQESNEISSFASWIFTIARNRVIDYYRTKKTFADLYELENSIEYEDNVINSIDLDIASKQFLNALEILSGDQQEVLRLKFFDDLENEEIAAIMDKTPGTVRVIQHRAIVALKKHLNENQLFKK